MKELEIKH